MPTAPMVVEIVSPHDKTFEKFDFYGRHGVEEIMVADLDERSVRLWRSSGERPAFQPVDESAILGATAAGLKAAVDWP